MQTTELPVSAKQAPWTNPTYPVPMIEISMFFSFGFGVRGVEII